MSEPRVNVDHFYHRPAGDVVGLLTGKSEIPAISADLESAGADVAAVEILCGEQGARILDQDGRYHGLQARMVRAVQRFGYAGTTLAIYDTALRDGDLLLRVPVRHADRQRTATLLQRHQAHDLGYFDPRSSSSPIRADPDLPPEQPAAPPTRPARTSCRARRPPRGRSRPATRSARGFASR